jgi:DNA-binding PadR family transcriptional regulator
MHGYKLHEFLAHQLSFVSELKRPTAYRLLDQMYREGLVERDSERAGKRPERFVYRLTPAGRDRFLALLRAQLASAQRAAAPANVALLFSDHLSAGERRRFLQQRLTEIRAQHSSLVEVVAAHAVGTGAPRARARPRPSGDRNRLADRDHR